MATEDRWHDFAKEKPSEDMEGRNFIVSNGHYEKIATWCGYWENEPFMGDKLCDEVVRWKFYFTPEEEKANEATCNELFVEEGYNGAKYYDKDAVDALLAEKDAEIEKLKARIQLDDDEMAGFLQLEEECGGGDLRNYIAELKQKLEDAKATAYAESVDAGMRERRLRRALWLARAERANEKQQLFHFSLAYNKLCINGFYNPSSGRRELSPKQWIKVFNKVETKCRAKAEEYK